MIDSTAQVAGRHFGQGTRLEKLLSMKRFLIFAACCPFLLSTPGSASAQNKVIFLTSGTSWTVPSNWSSANNTVEVIGAGGTATGSAGGGGGSFSKANNISLTPGNPVTYQIGSFGKSITTTGATWFNGTSISNASVSAEGGCTSSSTTSCSNSISYNKGPVKFAGGRGGNYTSGYSFGGGGGGAAGPHGVGLGGKASNGAGLGGAGDNGYGGAGGLSPLGVGGAGSEWTAGNGATAGSYGGGAGGTLSSSPRGGVGGGAQSNGNGLIVLTYTPNAAALFVPNLNSSTVTAYPLGSNGNVTPLPSATPTPATELAIPTGIARDSNGNLYVANEEVDSVTVYAAGATGNAAPIATITGANTGLDNPYGIALDSSGNIYVANAGSLVGDPDTITVFPPLASLTGQPNYPNVTPTAIITGSATGLAYPTAIALDQYWNIYVANDGSSVGVNDSVTIYPPVSTGNVAPEYTISGANTGLDSPGGIAVDSNENIYVTNDGAIYGNADSITIYASGSNGNVAPSATLFPVGLAAPWGITVDSAGNLYVANQGSTEGSVDAVTVYPPNGLVASATIGLDTGLDAPSGITLDSSGNIYVTNEGSVSGALDSVNVYPPGSYANVAPGTAIIGANTGLAEPYGIAMNSSGNLYVANSVGGPDGLGSITVYPATSNGNVSPSATISGNSTIDNTGFNFPTGIAFDSSGNLYVANAYGGPDGVGSITIYPAGSNGNVTPTATISDNPNCAPCDNTTLSFPYGVALDQAGNIYVVNSAGGADGLGSITIYPPLGSSTGTLNEAPSTTIAGTSTSDITGFNSPSGITLDLSANICVVNDGSWNGGADSITVYAAGSRGNVAPSATITGSSTGLGLPQGIAIGTNGGSSGGAIISPVHRHKKHKGRRR